VFSSAGSAGDSIDDLSLTTSAKALLAALRRCGSTTDSVLMAVVVEAAVALDVLGARPVVGPAPCDPAQGRALGAAVGAVAWVAEVALMALVLAGPDDSQTFELPSSAGNTTPSWLWSSRSHWTINCLSGHSNSLAW
jgi:hypothetical protein